MLRRTVNPEGHIRQSDSSSNDQEMGFAVYDTPHALVEGGWDSDKVD